MSRKKKREFHEEDFTLKLALVDTIPVLLFLGSMVVVSLLFHSLLFTIGAACSLIAGFSKVIWKFLLGLKKGNVKWLSDLFIPFQCIGFVLMTASFIVDRSKISFNGVWNALTGMPSMIFFLTGMLGMVGMIVLSIHFDQSIKAHWKAQYINIVAQAAILIGFLCQVK